jgi:drug/metabolite transporter (DMT)-like permease
MSFLFAFFAIQEGSMSLTALISSYSLLIPTFYGLVFGNEKISVFLILGLITLVISLFFTIYNKDEKNERITKKWIIYVLLAFIGNGLCSTVQRIQQQKLGVEFKDSFMIVAYAISAVISFTVALIYERPHILPTVKIGWKFFVICGISNAATNLCVILLNVTMPASVLFPVIAAGGTLLTVLAAMFFYKEKLSLFRKIGIAFGIVSVVFLNL